MSIAIEQMNGMNTETEEPLVEVKVKLNKRRHIQKADTKTLSAALSRKKSPNINLNFPPSRRLEFMKRSENNKSHLFCKQKTWKKDKRADAWEKNQAPESRIISTCCSVVHFPKTETLLLASSRIAEFREQRKRADDKNEKVSHSRCLSDPTGQSVFSSLTSWPRRRR